jgi:hypothetical protein
MDLIEPAIVWHNSSTDDIQMWFMDGPQIKGRNGVVDENDDFIRVGPPWSIVGTSDMDGNGKFDIVWHNAESNDIQIWFMDGPQIKGRNGVVDENGDFIRIGPPWSIVGASSGNAFLLRMRDRIHQHYLNSGGREGLLGFPISDVRSAGSTATRDYRGGEIRFLDAGNAAGFVTRQASVRFVGFRCVEESEHDQLTDTDEPYFVITVDTGDGRPVSRKFGPFENVETGTVVTDGSLIVDKIAPNPMAVKVSAYEHDRGDPDETATKLQETLVELSRAASSAAAGSAAAAADGPGVGPAGAAATAGGIIAGPIGALAAAGIVASLGLGDDFISQGAALAFVDEIKTKEPHEHLTPDAEFNTTIRLDGEAEGVYDVFFDIRVVGIPDPIAL